jgi:hypothetical protein
MLGHTPTTAVPTACMHGYKLELLKMYSSVVIHPCSTTAIHIDAHAI